MPDSTQTQNVERDLLTAITNARKTLGASAPRLVTEKPQIARNAIRHGLTGQTLFLPPIELRDYLILGAEYIEELRPVTVTHVQMVQQIIDTNWRLNSAIALAAIVHQSSVIQESQDLYAANPLTNPTASLAGVDSVHIHAQALAIQRHLEDTNIRENLSRQETRLRRALSNLRAEYHIVYERTSKNQRESWRVEGSRSYLWYRQLADLASRLIDARAELTQNSVEVISTVDAAGQPVSAAESKRSPENLFCKKTLQLLRPLTPATIEILNDAYKNHLLTEIEATLFPLPEAVELLTEAIG